MVLMMLDGKISMNDVNTLINETQVINAKEDKTNSVTNNTNTESRASSEIRNLKMFTGIDVSAGVRVNFTQSNTQKVEVITDPGQLKYIGTEVENGILRIFIDSRGERNLRLRNIQININAPRLATLKVRSGARFDTQNTVNENNFSISVSSGASLNANLKAQSNADINISSGASAKLVINADQISAEGSSGSSLTIEGKAKSVRYEMSSAASVTGYDLVAQELSARVSSGASIKANATESLTTHTSSGGSVRYTGKPKNVNATNSSGGVTKNAD